MSKELSLTADGHSSKTGRQGRWSGWLPGAALVLLAGLALSAFLLASQLGPSRVAYEFVYGQSMWAMHASMHGGSGGMNGSGAMMAISGPQPAAEFDEQFYDFGSLAGAQQEVSHSFTLANRGNAPLRITAAYTTCGCARAEISAAVIPPGKAGLVTVYFKPGLANSRSATVRRGVILETNDPQRPQIEFWVQAAVGKVKPD